MVRWPAMIAELMAEIRAVLRDGGEWCDLEKAQSLAALVVGLRPRVACEIGVWMGGSLVPIALALRAVRELDVAAGRPATTRRVVGIDPWSKDASCAGQGGADSAWWSSVDHDAALAVLRARIDRHDLGDLVEVVRARSDDAPVPAEIGLLHVDGNHAEQATRDVARFAPAVTPGGILVLDDLSWSGGHVRAARDLAERHGFRELHPIGTGVVMQRVA